LRKKPEGKGGAVKRLAQIKRLGGQKGHWMGPEGRERLHSKKNIRVRSGSRDP